MKNLANSLVEVKSVATVDVCEHVIHAFHSNTGGDALIIYIRVGSARCRSTSTGNARAFNGEWLQ